MQGIYILLLVASKRVQVRKNVLMIGCKHDMFCRQTFEGWSGCCCRLDLFLLNKIFFERIFRL